METDEEMRKFEQKLDQVEVKHLKLWWKLLFGVAIIVAIIFGYILNSI